MVEVLQVDPIGHTVSEIITTWSQRVIAQATRQESITEDQVREYVMQALPDGIPLDDSFGATRDSVLVAVRTHFESIGKAITTQEEPKPAQVTETAIVVREEVHAVVTSTPAPLSPEPAHPEPHETQQQKTEIPEDDLSQENLELLERVTAEVDLPEDFAESPNALLDEVFHQVLGRTDKGATDLELDFSEEDGTFDLAAIDIPRESVDGPTKAKPGSEEKLRVIAGRYAHGLPLWHKEDVTLLAPRLREKDPEEE